MFSIVRSTRLSRNLAFCSLLLLAACGGGGGDSGTTGPVPAPNPGPNPGPAPNPPPPALIPQLAADYTDIVADTTLGRVNWPAGGGVGDGSPVNGVECLPDSENYPYHIHSMISIYHNGERIALPKEIGIRENCNYELHTHDGTGVVHVEANQKTTFTLGQFFSVWGELLSPESLGGLGGKVRVYLIEDETVNLYDGDPSAIEFKPHREIAIVIGTPPATLAKHRWPHDL